MSFVRLPGDGITGICDPTDRREAIARYRVAEAELLAAHGFIRVADDEWTAPAGFGSRHGAGFRYRTGHAINALRVSGAFR